ncbi:TPA: TraR/DksA C4-type zinc finger protein [Escherichia coli]|nr:TraR/DksA C4-type zinc finger protein [Escherichia coli]
MTTKITNEVDHVDILENGEVYDEGDQAQHLQLMSIAQAQRQAKERANRPLSPEFDGIHCIECGDQIPEKRLLTIRTDLCVDCQQYLDDVNKKNNR